MARMFIVRHGSRDLFEIGQTAHSVEKALERLQSGSPVPLSIYKTVETDEAVAVLVFLRHALRVGTCTLENGREAFAVAEAEMKTALAAALRYLDDFIATKAMAQELAGSWSDNRVVKPSSSDLALHRRLCEIRDEQDRLAVQRAYCESRIKARIGQASALENLVVWKSESRGRFDLKSFQQTEPEQYADLFARFHATSHVRSFKLQRLA